MTLALAGWPLPVILEGCALLPHAAHQLLLLLLQRLPTSVRPTLLQQVQTLVPSPLAG